MAAPEAQEAAEAYLTGRNLAESLYQGDSAGYSDELEEYFAGAYLDYWKQDLSAFTDEGYRTDGVVVVGVARAGDVERVGDTLRVGILACIDYSDSTVLGPDGPLDRGYEEVVDDVYMVKRDNGTWKADGANSQDTEGFTGTPCEGLA